MPETTTLQDDQTRTETMSAPEPEYDDGLVHDHSWACGERGAPAH